MKCSSCGAADVTRAATLWERETRVAVSGIGRRNDKRANAPSQSLSALKLAPPERRRGWAPAIWMGLGLFLAALILMGIAAPLGLLVLIAAIVVPIVWGLGNAKKKTAIYNAAMAHWNRLWYCNRCGNLGEETAFQSPLTPIGAVENPAITHQ